MGYYHQDMIEAKMIFGGGENHPGPLQEVRPPKMNDHIAETKEGEAVLEMLKLIDY